MDVWAPQVLLQTTQSAGSSKAAQMAPRDGAAPPQNGGHTACLSSSSQLRAPLTAPAVHDLSPAQHCDGKATCSPPGRGSCSLVVHSLHKSRGNMLTNRLASLTHPCCAPRAASSPQHPSLPPVTWAGAASREVMLCSYELTWSWTAIRSDLQSHLQLLPSVRGTVPVPG